MSSDASHNSKIPRWTSPWSFFGLSVYQLFTLMVLVLCVPALSSANLLDGCAETYDPTLDYFPNKINQAHAEDFSIQYYLNYKIVQNIRTSEIFCLYQCGTPAPTHLNSSTKFFPVPFTKIAITSTVEITLLELLGLRTRIKYIADPQYVTSPCIQSLVTNNTIKSLSSNDTLRDIQISEVDGIFEFSADPSDNRSISVSTSADPGTLHRTAWIGFMAAFFNMEAMATQVYNEIAARYDCVSSLALTIPAKPIVAWVDFYNTYQIDVATYKLEYISDLGATPLAPVVNSFTNVNDWKAAMADVDIVIDEIYMGNMDTFYSTFNLSSTSTEFKFIKNGQVWRFDKLQSDFGGYDWFEGAVANADAVLEDLLTIVKPQAQFPHTRIWFRDSFHNEAVVVEGAGKCVDPTAPAQLRSDPCVAPTPTPSAFPTSAASHLAHAYFASFVALIIFLFAAFDYLLI